MTRLLSAFVVCLVSGCTPATKPEPVEPANTKHYGTLQIRVDERGAKEYVLVRKSAPTLPPFVLITDPEDDAALNKIAANPNNYIYVIALWRLNLGESGILFVEKGKFGPLLATKGPVAPKGKP